MAAQNSLMADTFLSSDLQRVHGSAHLHRGIRPQARLSREIMFRILFAPWLGFPHEIVFRILFALRLGFPHEIMFRILFALRLGFPHEIMFRILFVLRLGFPHEIIFRILFTLQLEFHAKLCLVFFPSGQTFMRNCVQYYCLVLLTVDKAYDASVPTNICQSFKFVLLILVPIIADKQIYLFLLVWYVRLLKIVLELLFF